ncbi:MAG TPA: hypothetical protein VNV86_01810 [Candidatus Acidoferrum sp.]|nr:hypothetical protein [Candidatus Acidoferrum sp.]
MLDVAIREDDRHYFPPYEWLGELSGRLPDAVMRKLNFAVDGEHRPPAQVAERFLNSAFR